MRIILRIIMLTVDYVDSLPVEFTTETDAKLYTSAVAGCADFKRAADNRIFTRYS